ncbi:hypothetical protein FE257_007347 [Aspergillus nanangensis]|uniref:Uncharacterized protein n=1 Tax=Aspergillus nanangensis TaxID=2582783 RepID=A0AAD4CMU7_ASPNN|nr:hypothetical protein FE257_007347 [Aspergillus nanangensis]
MTIMSGSAEALSKPTAFFLMRTASRSSNSRIPPIARRSSSPMPCRMARLSRDKLHKEVGAKSPDLRRCLGHQRLFRRSIEVAQEDARKAVAAVQMDDSDSDSDGDDDYSSNGYLDYDSSPSPIREQLTNAMRAMVKRRTSNQPRGSSTGQQHPVSMIRVSSKVETTDEHPQEVPLHLSDSHSHSPRPGRPTNVRLPNFIASASSRYLQNLRDIAYLPNTNCMLHRDDYFNDHNISENIRVISNLPSVRRFSADGVEFGEGLQSTLQPR